ncbi:MAG: hypothetical protein Q7U57_01780 [Methylovulum sp.]|nr:hypothetical protein [Methylovulum sp.]
MTNKKLTSLEQLDRLTESLVNDIIELSDEEILSEAQEQFDDPAEELDRLRKIIKAALIQANKNKLAEAKKQVNNYKSQTLKNNVITLPISEKRKAIESFTNQDPELKDKLTLAARKGEGIKTENDVEGMFEDMAELGIIDHEGNPIK